LNELAFDKDLIKEEIGCIYIMKENQPIAHGYSDMAKLEVKLKWIFE
jgi:hypothetical protein